MARLIDADDFVEYLEKAKENAKILPRELREVLEGLYEEVIETIKKRPTVDAVEVVHGRWKPRPHHKFNSEGILIKYCDFYYCSECGTERPMVPPYNYCPNCGAKMDGDGNG